MGGVLLGGGVGIGGRVILMLVVIGRICFLVVGLEGYSYTQQFSE